MEFEDFENIVTDYLKHEISSAIATHFPFSLKSVIWTIDKVKSVDVCLALLNHSAKSSTSLYDIVMAYVKVSER
jgi:hypothetical protein